MKRKTRTWAQEFLVSTGVPCSRLTQKTVTQKCIMCKMETFFVLCVSCFKYFQKLFDVLPSLSLFLTKNALRTRKDKSRRCSIVSSDALERFYYPSSIRAFPNTIRISSDIPMRVTSSVNNNVDRRTCTELNNATHQPKWRLQSIPPRSCLNQRFIKRGIELSSGVFYI